MNSTIPTATPPAEIQPHETERQRGWDHAAAIPEPQRTQVYRQQYRAAMDPFSIGFREFYLGQHEGPRR